MPPRDFASCLWDVTCSKDLPDGSPSQCYYMQCFVNGMNQGVIS